MLNSNSAGMTNQPTGQIVQTWEFPSIKLSWQLFVEKYNQPRLFSFKNEFGITIP